MGKQPSPSCDECGCALAEALHLLPAGTRVRGEGCGVGERGRVGDPLRNAALGPQPRHRAGIVAVGGDGTQDSPAPCGGVLDLAADPGVVLVQQAAGGARVSSRGFRPAGAQEYRTRTPCSCSRWISRCRTSWEGCGAMEAGHLVITTAVTVRGGCEALLSGHTPVVRRGSSGWVRHLAPSGPAPPSRR